MYNVMSSIGLGGFGCCPIIVRWTKGFKCQGVEGEDVVRLLHEAAQRQVCVYISKTSDFIYIGVSLHGLV